MAALETRHLTILLTDIKGFTDKTSHQTRADIQAMLDEHRAIVLPLLESGGGRLVKTIGDAFLMTFESPTNAVLAGLKVQEALAKRNEGRAPDDRLEIRIAINAGEVNLAEGDVFGEPVNITARIEGIAEAGQVYFTEAVYLAMNKAEVPSSEVGLMQLKGIPEKIRVYKVRREDPVSEVSAAPPDRNRFFGLLPPRQASATAAAPAGFSPGVKAYAVPSVPAALPSHFRRAVAVGIDLLICWTIAGAMTSGSGGKPPPRIHLTKTSPPAAVSSNGKTVTFGGGAAKLKFDDTGVHGKVGDTTVGLDATGLRITDSKDKPKQKTLYDDKKGDKVAVDDDVSGGDESVDSFLHRAESSNAAFAVIWAVYNLIFLKLMLGSTPGKKAMKLRVISTSGAPLDKRQRLMRSAFSVISFDAAGLGYLWALWEPQRRTWHDLVADTRVVPAE